MTGSEPMERKKKKKQKSESQDHNNQNMMKKKQKKKAGATEDASEIMDVVPKKKKKSNEMLEDMASSDPKIYGDVPKKKMREGTHKKKKKKNLLVKESSTCDSQTNEDVPKKKKKKNIVEDAGSCQLESIDPGHKKDKNAALEDGREIVTKKKKKSKPAKNKSEDGALGTGNILTDVSAIKKKKRKEASELVEKSGSPIEDQPEMSDHAKVKKKKKKASSVKTDGGSLRVSKQKKKSKGSNIEHSESDLKGNRDKDCDVPSEGGLKKKKGNKREETTKFVDGAEKSIHGTYREEKKSKKKRKKEEMQKHTDEEDCANEDTTEVPKKKKNKETKNSKGASKKREESKDVQLVSAQDGNTDEVKQKALQADIDREPGSTKGKKFGQWGTATFQNSEQQSKFFRLLGGFKKGNQETSSQVTANMALVKEGEQALERNLLAEFDKAVSRKQNRGIGLGFQPAPNKIFYIDKTRSTSVKFED